MKLFISGLKFTPTTKEPPVVTKIKKFLDGSKSGELFYTTQVSAALGCSKEPLSSNNYHLQGYFHVWRQKKHWGKKATITKFKTEISNNGNG